MHEIQITEFLKSNFAIAARSIAFGVFIILLGAKALAEGGATDIGQDRMKSASAQSQAATSMHATAPRKGTVIYSNLR